MQSLISTLFMYLSSQATTFGYENQKAERTKAIKVIKKEKIELKHTRENPYITPVFVQ